jgi:hypothetical protein
VYSPWKSQKNPEDHVLDAIDQLVNEQLAVGPVDDYSVDRYPHCSDCGHQWHGEKCHWCHCEQSTGEQYDDCQRVRPDGAEDEGWHLVGHTESGRPGYTQADLERMRSWRPNRSWVHPHYPQRYILDNEARPRVRFWEHNLERDLYTMIEGTAEVMQIDWNRDGCTMVVRLEPVVERYIAAEELRDPAPTDPVPVGMIAFEGAEDEGWQLVGHLHPDDLQFDQTVDYVEGFGGGDVMRCTRERYEVTVQIRDAPPPPLGPGEP